MLMHQPLLYNVMLSCFSILLYGKLLLHAHFGIGIVCTLLQLAPAAMFQCILTRNMLKQAVSKLVHDIVSLAALCSSGPSAFAESVEQVDSTH